MSPLESLMRRWLADGTEVQKAHAAARLAMPFDAPLPARPEATTRRGITCTYLGGPVMDGTTQATRLCPTCGGSVRLKVFACLHPLHAADPTATAPGCEACPDYLPSGTN